MVYSLVTGTSMLSHGVLDNLGIVERNSLDFFAKERAKKTQCAALLLPRGLDSLGSNNRKPCQRSALWHNRSKRIEGFKRSADAIQSVIAL